MSSTIRLYTFLYLLHNFRILRRLASKNASEMVKFGKNKFKALNKIAKREKAVTHNTTNKILKKKLNAEKKVSFQKEVLLKEAVSTDSPLVKNVSSKDLLLNELSKKSVPKKTKSQEQETKPKLKPVEKKKKRQQSQISDTKLLLQLMKKR